MTRSFSFLVPSEPRTDAHAPNMGAGRMWLVLVSQDAGRRSGVVQGKLFFATSNPSLREIVGLEPTGCKVKRAEPDLQKTLTTLNRSLVE